MSLSSIPTTSKTRPTSVSGDFQYTCPRASCEQSACADAHDLLLVSVLVSQVDQEVADHVWARRSLNLDTVHG